MCFMVSCVGVLRSLFVIFVFCAFGVERLFGLVLMYFA